MNRRGFLKALGAGAVGVVATPAILEALAPTRSIFLPPRGGWFRANVYGGKLHENLVQMPPTEFFITETSYFDPKLLAPIGPSIEQLQLEGWLDA